MDKKTIPKTTNKYVFFPEKLLSQNSQTVNSFVCLGGQSYEPVFHAKVSSLSREEGAVLGRYKAKLSYRSYFIPTTTNVKSLDLETVTLLNTVTQSLTTLLNCRYCYLLFNY